MILKDLEYICEVARQGTLSEAAKNLSISQPALSLFVSNLETELGIRLFTRKKNRLQITPEGKIYVQTASEMLDVRNRLYAQLHALKSQQKIRIGLASNYGFHIFSQVLASHKEFYADADISVSEGRAFSLLHLLKHLELDFITGSSCFKNPSGLCRSSRQASSQNQSVLVSNSTLYPVS